MSAVLGSAAARLLCSSDCCMPKCVEVLSKRPARSIFIARESSLRQKFDNSLNPRSLTLTVTYSGRLVVSTYDFGWFWYSIFTVMSTVCLWLSTNRNQKNVDMPTKTRKIRTFLDKGILIFPLFSVFILCSIFYEWNECNTMLISSPRPEQEQRTHCSCPRSP